MGLGRYAEALELQKLRIELDAGLELGLMDCSRNALLAERADCLASLGRYDEAFAEFERSECSQSLYPFWLLRLGHFAEGAAALNKHLDANRVNDGEPAGQPWNGIDDISGRRLVIRDEEDLGECLQLARMVPELAARGIDVTLEVPRKLMGLDFLGAKIVGAGGAR
jgi:hypothetical protein